MRVYHDFFWYLDPDQRFLMRIRIRPNDTDPTGSGSETLILAFALGLTRSLASIDDYRRLLLKSFTILFLV